MVAKTLFIILSDKYNFDCEHCIHQANQITGDHIISETEITEVARFINDQQSISEVHFTGGEPNLFVDQIISLQKEISRDVKYSLTTNGWFAENDPLNLLRKINIDIITISVDKFNEKFISLSLIRSLVSLIKDKTSIQVKMRATISSLEDIVALEEYKSLQVEIVLEELINIGEVEKNKVARNKNFVFATSVFCPSFNNAELEKIFFFPHRGFTFCCGPLVLKNLVQNERIFSFLGDKIEELFYFKKISKNPSLGFDAVGCRSSHSCSNHSLCEKCEFIFAEKYNNKSLYEVLHEGNNPGFIKSEDYLAKEQLVEIEKKYSVKYTLIGHVENKVYDDLVYLPNEITVEDDVHLIEQIGDFLDVVYYHPYADLITDENSSESKKILLEMIPKMDYRRFYYKNMKLVAIFSALIFDPHPYIGKKTFHIGFWGYKRNNLTIDESMKIKNDWMKNILLNNFEKLPVSAAVYSYAISSYLLANKIGLIPFGYFLRKRDQ